MKATTVLIGEVSERPFNSYYLLESQTDKGKIYGIMVSNKNDDLKNFYEYTINFLLNENSVKKLIENKTFENLIFLIKSNSE